MEIEYRSGDSDYVIAFKIAAKLDELLGDASAADTKPRQLDSMNTLLRKILNSLNSGALS